MSLPIRTARHQESVKTQAAFVVWRENPDRSVRSIMSEFRITQKETVRLVAQMIPIWILDEDRERVRTSGESDWDGYVPATMGSPGLGKRA